MYNWYFFFFNSNDFKFSYFLVSRPIGRGRKRHKRHKPVNSGVRKPAHTSEQPSQQCIKEEIVPEINDPHSGTKDHRMTVSDPSFQH